jgi:hypothetical protein
MVYQRLSEVSWPTPHLAEFHLKLVTAAQAGLADPISIIDAQRRGGVAAAARRAAGGAGGAGTLACGLVAGGSRLATPGALALARSVRAVLDRSKGAVITPPFRMTRR